MSVLFPHRLHINSPDDLITTPAAIRSGFIRAALEKNRRASPFVEQARALKIAASQAKSPRDLLDMKDIFPALLTAAGVSDKAVQYFNEFDKTHAIQKLIEEFLDVAADAFVEELVYRFLLTRGGTLGGMMRNVVGELSSWLLNRSLFANLAIVNAPYMILLDKSDRWVERVPESLTNEKLKGIGWKNRHGARTLLYNVTVPLLGKNVDICLLHCEALCIDKINMKKLIANQNLYLALGELKGGIDPSGADEHWKTARTALGRISKSFSEKSLQPRIFFIGAAIASSMAREIWLQLENGRLHNVANLTNEDQVASLCQWLCNI